MTAGSSWALTVGRSDFSLQENYKKGGGCMHLAFSVYFFRETPASPWVPFRAKFRPLWQLFCPPCYETNPKIPWPKLINATDHR